MHALGVHAAQSFISNAREELPMGEDEKKMWFWLTILPLIAFGLVAVVLWQHHNAQLHFDALTTLEFFTLEFEGRKIVCRENLNQQKIRSHHMRVLIPMMILIFVASTISGCVFLDCLDWNCSN